MGALGKVIAELLLAIQGLSGYAAPAAQPAVSFVVQTELAEMACGHPCEVYGWFPPGQVIYLDDRLDPLRDVGARGILVHELVHYLQQEQGAFGVVGDCDDWLDREREAFDIQIRWLAAQSAPLNAVSPFGKVPIRVACDDGGPAPAG